MNRGGFRLFMGIALVSSIILGGVALDGNMSPATSATGWFLVAVWQLQSILGE